MPGRKYSSSSLYRYGFNGKENDNEVKGEGSQQDYGLRVYDPRVVKFFSVDPLSKEYPWYSPYQFAGNKPIQAIDIEGAEETYKLQQSALKTNIQLGEYVAETKRQRALWQNQTILSADIYGNGHIGPRFIVEPKIARIRQEYVNAVGDNIKGGPFGAGAYLIGGDRFSFYGAAVDNLSFSITGLPSGPGVLSPRLSPKTQKKFSFFPITTVEHPPLNLAIELKWNWTPAQITEAYNKAQAITENPNTKTVVNTVRPANLRKKYIKQGGTIARNQHLDHTTDLQLNGSNEASNLRPIDPSVNMSFGAQLKFQTQNVPDGTRVNTVSIKAYFHDR